MSVGRHSVYASPFAADAAAAPVRRLLGSGDHNVIPGSANMLPPLQHQNVFADTQCGNTENYRECRDEFCAAIFSISA
jgi:hypothetical protein